MSRTGINKKEALQLLEKLVEEKTAFKYTCYTKSMGRFGTYRYFKLEFYSKELNRETMIQIDGRTDHAVQKFIFNLLEKTFFEPKENIVLEYKVPVEEIIEDDLPELESTILEGILSDSAEFDSMDLKQLKEVRLKALGLMDKLKGEKVKNHYEVIQEIIIDLNKTIREKLIDQSGGSENENEVK